jgi:hypothetical protein
VVKWAWRIEWVRLSSCAALSGKKHHLWAISAGASNVTGTWSGTFKVNGGDHSIPRMMLFKQDRTKLNGSAGPDATTRRTALVSLQTGK